MNIEKNYLAKRVFGGGFENETGAGSFRTGIIPDWYGKILEDDALLQGTLKTYSVPKV